MEVLLNLSWKNLSLYVFAASGVTSGLGRLTEFGLLILLQWE
jgi:hypothetical protein